MKKTNGIFIINYQKIFEKSLELKKELLLDIEVFGVINEWIDKKVSFNIFNSEGTNILYPIGNYERYCIVAKQVVEATELKIEKDDYLSATQKDENYIFVMEEKDE